MKASTGDHETAFLCDHMLGTLARWLRILGFDASYPRSLPDDALLDLAQREERILLTRDKDLRGRRNVHTLYISSDVLDEQVEQVLRNLGLRIQSPLSRCPVCNEVVVEASREEAAGAVPEGVLTRQERFWKCPECGRYYWQGTHWARMSEKIERYRILTGNSSSE